MSLDSHGFDPRFQEDLKTAHEIVKRIDNFIGQQLIGQQQLRLRLITALITDSHLLLEGVPGLAKTLAIKALAQAINASFKRIQFTPDLLPADLIGSEIFRPQDGKFEVRKGPVFANLVLADEINRAPAKVQSALLEIMQEHQVTIGETTFRVPEPFFVMATQNPIEQEGTYPLPEAQIDRFMMKVRVGYPDAQEERRILDHVTRPPSSLVDVSPAATIEDLVRAKNIVGMIYVDERIKQYVVDLVSATRTPEKFKLKLDRLIELGASPRGTISLFLAARAEALLKGMTYVSPQHVKDVALDVLRHRVIPTYEAEAQGLDSDALVKMILEGVPVP